MESHANIMMRQNSKHIVRNGGKYEKSCQCFAKACRSDQREIFSVHSRFSDFAQTFLIEL